MPPAELQRRKWLSYCLSVRQRSRTLPMKDASDCLVAGKEGDHRGDISKAKPHQPDGIIAVSELRDVIAVDEAAGAVEWPYSQLDSILRGIRPAEMTCIVSGTGQGRALSPRS